MRDLQSRRTPLSASQQSLRGRSVQNMTVDQLRDWIDACCKMENWVKFAKARRGWRQSGQDAQEELQRRPERSTNSGEVRDGEGVASDDAESSPVFNAVADPDSAGVGNETMRSTRYRIMYIENKSAQKTGTKGVQGPAVIGRVTFSKTGRTLYYQGRKLMKTKGGYKYNHIDEETGEHFWISGPKKNGEDGLYGYRPVPIDDDVREEYWIKVRGKSARASERMT